MANDARREPIDDEPEPTGAPGSSAVEAPAPDEVVPWQRRCEVIALVLVVCALGAVLQALFQGLALARGAGPDGGVDWDVLLPVLASSGTFVNGLLLAVALALVVLAPGARVSRLGSATLNAVAVVGVVVATLAVLGLEETIRNDRAESAMVGAAADDGADLLVTLGGVSLWLPSIALAGLLAYLSWRMVLELYADAVRDVDPDPR